MKKYSRVYVHKLKNRPFRFRYNFKEQRMEYVCKPNEEMLADIKKDLNSSINWIATEARDNMKSYKESGYIVIDSYLLFPESWKKDRKYFMENMSAYIVCEDLGWEVML